MTTHSGDTSPGGSNSMSDSSVRTQTSEESQVIPHKAFHLDCYNSSPDQDDDESDGQCDDETLSQLMLHSDLLRPRTSIGVQTDHNEDFPPLKFLQALIGEDHNNTAAGFLNQQQLYYSSGGGGGSEVPHPQQTPSSQLPNIPTTNLSTAATATTPTTPITTATAINTTTTAIDASSSSTDGTLQLVIQNFRHMSDTVRGPCKYIQNVPWRIMVMPRQHVVQKKGTQKCLGFFLQCCPDAYSESWSCQASAELRLISQKSGIPNFIRKTNHVYTAKENDWGYSCFMTWADILDESQGYIKDDKVTLEVQVKADTPKNILTHSEFKKKIQDYKRLADMQCQRGLIDKAIECNTQALKFCKDKDQQCKTELEAQKAHLIEMKLKQSIQRIEKGNDGNKLEDDSTTNLNALRQALGTSTRCNAAAKGSTSSAAATTKNKSTSTKDSNTTTNPSMNNNNISAAEKQQQQQRAGTPPYTTQQKMDGRGDQKTAKQTQKTSKSVEPQGQKQQSSSSASNSKQKFTSTCGKEEAGKSTTKKRLYKSASTNEIFCAAGTQCKGYLNNNKALVALGHFNKALLNSDDFDYMKDRYQEEEDLLPDQIQHFLKHLSEGDKTALRLKEQMDKLEMLASPFNNKPDPFFEGLMKLSPEEADKAFVKAITYCAYEQDDDEDDDEEGNEQMDANQLEKRLSHVIRNKFCESCLKEGHFQFGKRETSESGCQTEFNPTRRKLREDDATLMMMQQLQQQQQLMGQPANDDYINALKNAFAAAQQQQGQPISPDQANEDYLNALKYAAAQQNQPVSEASEEYMNALKSHAAFAAAAAAQHQQQQNQPQMPIVPPEVEQEYMNALKSSHQAFAPSPRQQQQNQQPVPALPARRKKATAKKSLQQQQQQQSTQAQAQQQMQNYQQQNLLEQQQKLLEQQQQQFMQANELLKDENETLKAELMTLKSNDKKQSEQLAFVQKEFQNLNGKYEKLIQQLKDRKNEIKKLEKKAKSEAQLLTENQELLEKMEAMKKELGQAQRQLADEQAKYKRDTQSLADSKKHLSVELNSKYTEVQKLTTQFEEKGQAVKKLESQLANERKNNAQTITNLTERVKRAEVNLLEHKLEDGLRVLERAKEDCNAQIKVLEAEKQKRTSAAELEVVKKNIAEWESKREEVVQLIGQAKTDFQAHIQAVKSGKQLSQLPKIQVPKPPPCPKIHPMPQTIQATSVGPFQVVPQSPLTLERKVITPPNRTRIGAITPQQQGQQPQIATPSQIPPSPGIGIGPAHQFQPIGMTTPQPPTISHSQSANVTPVKGGGQFQHSPATMTSQPPPIGHVPPQPPSTIAPIGSRPSNYQNGISVPPPPHQSTPQQAHKFQMQSQPGAPGQHRQSPQMVPLMGQFQPTGPPPPTMHHPQFNIAPPSTATIGQPPHIQQQQAQQTAQQQNTGGGSYQTWNGGWGASGGSAGGAGDHLTNMNNIGDIFGQGRSFGPLGSDFGGGSQAIGGYRSASVTHQPPAGVIGPPGSNAATNPSSQPIGAGRNVQNVSPSQSQQNQQRNGWSTFSTDTWNPALSGRQN